MKLQDIIELLVCPKCKGVLVSDECHQKLICKLCKLAYPVEDEIPVLLEDKAEPLSDFYI